MNSRTKVIQIEGIVGSMEMSIDLPDELKNDPAFAVRGLASPPSFDGRYDG